MVTKIIANWQPYCTEENCIGIGSTRKVYRVNEYVIKKHLHPIGYKQSLYEIELYQYMKEHNAADLFAEMVYVNEEVCIQRYYENLELKNDQTYELNISEDVRISNRLRAILLELDRKFDSFDLKDSSNFGLTSDGELILIDYGMTKSLYEKEWVPLAEAGELPQIYFETCRICGIQKELRMYGKEDKDKRCYGCGKQ
ncbi:protein kinase [Viridibacillus sp. YIM B01967]|uniref:Protein kinase n=1 Tax=Viridibacillus soli TaxID=2798301 RepID=A0ABS1HAH6_9BACL|nr:protein kinase [Viridibacillus soli]MBK3496434.1 protein kinase [Viridibacillus soli]